jgi:DnaD/phage-associated family protein
VKSADNPYVMIDRRPIDNPALSYKAKGLLTYLMSRPDGWEVSVVDLINHSTDGEDSVRSGMKELEKVGHMKRTRTRAAGAGKYTGLLIEVYELPHADFRHVDKPDVDKPDVENPTQVLSTSNSTERKKNESIRSSDDDDDISNVLLDKSSSSIKDDAQIVCIIYAEEIGRLSTRVRTEIKKAVAVYPLEWVRDAFREAVVHNVRKWSYVSAILARWKVEGKAEKRGERRSVSKVEYTQADREAAIRVLARRQSVRERHIEST